jgi:hypothetical protein
MGASAMSDAHATLVLNEQTKLLANLLNTVAGSSVTVGVTAPIAAMFFYSPVTIRFAPAVIGIIIWINIAGFCHLAARYILGGLKP